MVSGPKQRFRPLRILLILLLLAGGGGAYVWHRSRPVDKGGPTDADRLHTVVRGSFDVTVVQNGSLDAIKRHDLRPDASGRYKLEINWIVKDKTPVEPGNPIMRFAADEIEKAEEDLVLEIDEAKKDLVLAQQDLQMRRAANLSSIRSAADSLRNAREALKKYVDLEAPRKRKQLDRGITDAEGNLRNAWDKLAEARNNLWDAEWEDDTEREKLRDAVEQNEQKVLEAERALEKAQQDLRAFRQYDHPQKLRSLREAAAKTELDFRKAIADAEGNIVKEEQRIRNIQNQIKQKELDLKRLRKDLDGLEIVAPVAGIVNLGQPDRGRRWQQPKEMEVGTTVRPNEVVAYIPDLSQFLVNVDIPEEYRSLVEEGLPVRLRSAAIPDLVLDGSVSEIAPMPSHTIWWDKNSPKVYPTEIATDDTHPDLMPGLTMEVEIIVKTVKDVLFVPIEAVYNREGDTYCRVRTLGGWEERAVEVGESSLHYVVINRGLEEGDEVLLYRPEDEEPQS